MPVPPTGLEALTLAELRDAMHAEARSVFGTGVQLGPDSVLGQLIDLVANTAADAYGNLQGVYDSWDPGQAEGVNLDNLAALVGVTRLPATKSTAILDAVGVVATAIPAGTQFRVPAGPTFENLTPAVIGGGGTVSFGVTALAFGPTEAPAGSITEIVTPVVGLTSVTNPADAVVGRNVETDSELRVRREESLQASGQATDPAIRAALLALDIVGQCIVVSNRSAVVDAFGIPAHSFRAVVYPDPGVFPLDTEIFETIFETMPAGIQPDGARTATVTDSQGIPQAVKYSVATELDTHLAVVRTTDATYPVDGDDQIKSAIVALADGLSVGERFSLLKAVCAAAEVQGVLTASVFARVGGAPVLGPPDDVDIVPSIIEVVVVDIANVTVS